MAIIQTIGTLNVEYMRGIGVYYFIDWFSMFKVGGGLWEISWYLKGLSKSLE
jgi:hypothetical protein